MASKSGNSFRIEDVQRSAEAIGTLIGVVNAYQAQIEPVVTTFAGSTVVGDCELKDVSKAGVTAVQSVTEKVNSKMTKLQTTVLDVGTNLGVKLNEILSSAESTSSKLTKEEQNAEAAIKQGAKK